MANIIDDEQNNKNEKNSLKISTKGKQVLSKNQQTFNRLTTRIQNLEKEIVGENGRLQELHKVYLTKLKPVLNEIAIEKIQLAIAISKKTFEIKFSKSQLFGIKEVILDLCNEAFEQKEPSPEQETFYNSWSAKSYKEEIEEQESLEKKIFAGMMNGMYGMNIDPDEIDEENDFENFQQKMRDQFEENQNELNKKKKKTKKQIELEEQKKAEEDIKNKSIRSIYIALVKILHPDTEQDSNLKIEKEEIMKQVTVAYDNKDLPALLKLEMEWVHKETNHLEKLTDEKLLLYISVLKQQSKELEKEKFMIRFNPKYEEISYYCNLNDKVALSHLLKESKNLTRIKNETIKQTTNFEKLQNKKEIVSFIEDCIHDYEEDEDDFDFLDFMNLTNIKSQKNRRK